MPFDRNSMSPIAGFENSNAPRLWCHIQDIALASDPSNVQLGAGYFNEALDDFDIQPGDFMYIGEGEGTASSVTFVGVTSISGGVVVLNELSTSV